MSLNEMMKTAVVVNQERTRAIQSNPAMSEVLKKIRDADTVRTSAKAVYDSKTPAIKTLGKRVSKNSKRYEPYSELTDVKELMVQPEGAKLRSFMDDRNLSPDTVNAQRDEARKWAKFYEKKYRKNPDALKNAPHDLKYYKKSKDLYQRALNDRDPYTQSFNAADSAKKEGIKAYKDLRRPLPPEPPVDKSKPKFKFNQKQLDELEEIKRRKSKLEDGLKNIFSDMSNEINNLHNESTEKIVNDSPHKHWKKIIPEADKVAPEVNPPVNPNPVPGRNRYLKPLAIGAGAAATIGGGAYLYNRYKKKKRAQAEEEEKTAGLLDDLMKAKNPLGLAAKKRSVNPLREAARKAQFEALSNMRVNSLGKKAFLDFAEMEKTALMNKIPTPYSQKPIGANPNLPQSKSLLQQANQAPYKPLKPIQAVKNTINNEYSDRFNELTGGRSPGQAVKGAYTKLKTKLTAPPTPIQVPKVEQATEAAKALGKSGKSFKFKAGTGLGVAALGAGAYLYGRNQGKKRQEEMGKYSTLESEDFEKIAVTKEEKAEMRRMVGMSKRKIKKRKPNKTKESTYRMKKQKKHAAYDDVELEKMASLMADQFIAASALTSVDPENMNLEEEIIAGYKSYLDEVSNQ